MNPLDWDAPWIVVALGLFVIVMARANGTYWVGRAISRGASRTRLGALMTSPGYRRASGWIATWGAPVVSVSFLTVGVQTLVNLAAGASRMPLRRYLPAVTFGSLIWACIYATVGVLSWRAFIAVYRRWPTAAVVAASLAAVALACYVVVQLRGGRRGRSVDPAQDEVIEPSGQTDAVVS